MTDGESKVKFVSVGLTPPARDMLGATTLQLTTPAGRRISMSTALLAILAERQAATGVGLDVSSAALEVADALGDRLGAVLHAVVAARRLTAAVDAWPTACTITYPALTVTAALASAPDQTTPAAATAAEIARARIAVLVPCYNEERTVRDVVAGFGDAPDAAPAAAPSRASRRRSPGGRGRESRR